LTGRRSSSCGTCVRRPAIVLAEHPADRLDPESTGSHLVDDSADQRWRGSSSREENRGRLRNLVGLLEISVPAQDRGWAAAQQWWHRAAGRHPPGPATPSRAATPRRPRPSGRSPGRRHTAPVLIKMIEHHFHRTLTLLDRLMLGHDLHPSHRTKRHQTRNGSIVLPPALRVSCSGSGWGPYTVGIA
jgi:hypothetical protein